MNRIFLSFINLMMLLFTFKLLFDATTVEINWLNLIAYIIEFQNVNNSVKYAFHRPKELKCGHTS